MSKDEFLAAMLEKLNIEKNEDALLLANYFIPQDVEVIKTWKVLDKIIQIAGPYRSFKDADFVKLKDTFENADKKKKAQFIKLLLMLTKNKDQHVTSKNFTIFLNATDIPFDHRAFIVLLLRKSKSISLIYNHAIKQVMYEILGYGEKKPVDDEVRHTDTNDEITQNSFANAVNKCMVTYKVAQAF